MSLQIKTLALGEMGTNCYLVWDDETSEGLVIDPGDEGDFISRKILEFGLKPVAIILSHGHFDHCLGLLEVKLNFKAPIYLNEADQTLYRRARQSAKRFLGIDPGPFPPIDQDLKDCQEFVFGQQKFTVMSTPGHTPGSITLTNNLSAAFTGDTLFKDGVGRTDFSYSRSEELVESIQKILSLPGWCKVYPGHGEPTTIQAEGLNFPA